MTVNRAERQVSRVLVVEDDSPTRELVAIVLRRGGHDVEQAADGERALEAFLSQRPDLVMLDLGLPGEDGLHLLDRLREISEVPVVVLSGLSDETAKVRALMRGADDYIVKPASAPELLARVSAVLRRTRRRPDETGGEVYDDGTLRVDLLGRTASLGGQTVSLTPLEYRVLCAFVRHPGEILSRARLLELAWGDAPGAPDEHVKLTIGYLRRKLIGLDGQPIETVRGFGYRWTRGMAATGESPAVVANA
jgi:DNA-binding response OmpR family regulator